jgi:ATP adenylyltransferase
MKEKKKSRLFVPSKMKYVKGDRPKVDCILCSVVNKENGVDALDIYSTKNFVVSANLFPYNPGHLMIFPKKHMTDIKGLSKEEVLELHELQITSIEILEKNYQAQAFNIGYNIGHSSGASIDHVHMHIVPRYPREVGFIDIIGDARIIVEDPKDTVQRLSKAFQELNKRLQDSK